MTRTKPLLAAAFLCEKVLEDKDNVLSAIRIVDTFTVVLPPVLPQGVDPRLAVTLLISLKAGDADGKHELKIRLRSPSGKELKGQYGTGHGTAEGAFTATFELKQAQPEGGANVVVNCSVPAKELGVYFFDVLVDDELMTKVPFKLRENAAR